jgi:SAM-dependent methyltransferase
MTSAQHHTHHHHEVDDQAELLDLDAEVLAEHLAAITASLPVDRSPGRIVDLGSGTGAGTCALLNRFPEAHVTAVDASAAHLQRLAQNAAARGVAGQVGIVQADLDADEWPDLGRPDVVWASASLHHMADPDRALREVHDLLAPGGLFAVVELAGFPRFLPADAPEDRPGLEERCHEAGEHRHGGQYLPHRGADWAAKLAEAGFAVEDERVIAVDIAGSHDNAVGAYALAALRRVLDTSGPHSILRRDDLAVRTERTVWTARRTG